MSNNILITGYPYIRENYLNTFNSYPQKDRIFFLLPEHWKVKKGKVIYNAPKRGNIFTTRAFFHHSDYPIVGGLLKGWMPSFPLKIWNLKRSRKVELLYDSGEPILLSTLYNAIFSKLLGLKYVFFSWENIPYDKKFHGLKGLVHRAILRLVLLLADGGICGNYKCKEIFSRLTKKPLAIIPLSGLDENFYKPLNDRSYLSDRGIKDKIIFTFIGAIGYRKGVHLILDAFTSVLKEVSNIHLVIAGSGEYEKKIEDLISELNLSNSVTRIPWLTQEDVIKLLSASDVFLYPSFSHGGWEEQFGYSMAEASLCELPVISTRSGSIEDVITDGETGVLVKENNTDDLVKAILRLAKDSELRKKLGIAGRQFIKERFANAAIAKKFSVFFNSL